MSEDLTAAIAEQAKATQEQAKATQELARSSLALADQLDRLWLALPPRTRAKLLGISTSAERARRAKSELMRLVA
ncbi:MAG: hypothetical protein WC378_01045 [Opitutaceae bacterium]|jgi:methyl-accepting chemotaxis protein